jgi:hypothetical protein
VEIAQLEDAYRESSGVIRFISMGDYAGGFIPINNRKKLKIGGAIANEPGVTPGLSRKP